MTSQRFCLRWNNHQSNLLSVFDQLLQDESFVDVTLAVDGKYLKAHKMVLSACSPYFQALFVGHPDKHPIVILKDIPFTDMRCLLDFMYRGEVSVDQDRLTTFLKVAESLRIKGLTEVNEEQCDLPKIASSLLSSKAQQQNQSQSSLSTSVGTTSSNYHQTSIQRLKRPLSSNCSPSQSSNTVLGSALIGPKRKRGLPRKLSGSGSDLILPEDIVDLDMDEEFDETRSVQSDSDMIERSDSPFDNKMLEVNVSEGTRRSSEESSTCNNTQDDVRDATTPTSIRDVESPAEIIPGTSQEPSDLVKTENSTDNPSAGEDQEDRISSPTPERYPPGKIQSTTMKIKSVSSSRKRKRLTKSITYELNKDVSLVRGIVYESEPGDDQCDDDNMNGSSDDKLNDDISEDLDETPAVECDEVLARLTKNRNNSNNMFPTIFGSGVHFLTSDNLMNFINSNENNNNNENDNSNSNSSYFEEDILTRNDLLEYLINPDGTCVCKLCGEVLQSRTRWYRHKYKLHTINTNNTLQETYICNICKICFKSKKGYIAHLQSKQDLSHIEELNKAEKDLFKSTNNTNDKESISLMTTILTEKDYSKQRELEEQLVKDIIAKVKKECEEQGDSSIRKGYTRKAKK